MILDIIKVVVTLVLLFLGYRLVLKVAGVDDKPTYSPPPMPQFEEKFQADPEPMPVIHDTPKPIPTERPIAPAGPNPPAQQAPHNERHIMQEEQPRDPYAEDQEDAYAAERIRNPERMYRPAPENDERAMAIRGGIASEMNAAPQQMSQFSPEMAQNGGMFMDGIAANDSFDDASYSSY